MTASDSRGSVADALDEWLGALGGLSPLAVVYARNARLLAIEIDDPPSTEKGRAPIAPNTTALMRLADRIAELCGADKPTRNGGNNLVNSLRSSRANRHSS